MPCPGDDRVLGLLEQMRDELVALRRVLEHQRRPAPSTLSHTDRARLARLLPAIAGALGSEPFAARELVNGDAAAAVRLVTRGRNARQLGRLFQRAEGQAVDGYVVARAGLELGAVLWRVLRVPGSALLLVPPRPPAPAV